MRLATAFAALAASFAAALAPTSPTLAADVEPDRVPTAVQEDCSGTCRSRLEVVWPTFVTEEGTCIIAGPVEEPRDGMYYRMTGGDGCERCEMISVATYTVGSRAVVITDSHDRRDDWGRI